MNRTIDSEALPKNSMLEVNFSDMILLMVAVIWGASYSLTKGALDYSPVLVFISIRFGITFLCLLPFTTKEILQAGNRALFKASLLGGILCSIFLAETYGVLYTSASNAAFLISLCVVFTPIIDGLWKRQRPNINIIFSAVLCLVGTWILTSGKSIDFNVGDGLIIVAAVLRGVMVTSTKRVTDAIELSSIALTQIQMAVVFVASTFLMYFSMDDISIPTQIEFWWRTIFIVLFCTLFAFFAQNYGVKHSGPTRASFLMGAEPLFGVVFAFLLLSEPFSVELVLGGLLITCGTFYGLKLTKEITNS